eukprot:68811_1
MGQNHNSQMSGRDVNIAINYRPIALLSCLGKILEKVMANRLTYHLQKHALLNINQAGFQPLHNTLELLIKLNEDIYSGFQNNSVINAIFLDMKSAYDTVWRDMLRWKLRTQYFITGNMYWLIDSFLKDRHGRVVVDGEH